MMYNVIYPRRSYEETVSLLEENGFTLKPPISVEALEREGDDLSMALAKSTREYLEKRGRFKHIMHYTMLGDKRGDGAKAVANLLDCGRIQIIPNLSKVEKVLVGEMLKVFERN